MSVSAVAASSAVAPEAPARVWLSSPHLGGLEQAYVQEAFDTNWVAPLGPNVDAFEASLPPTWARATPWRCRPGRPRCTSR